MCRTVPEISWTDPAHIEQAGQLCQRCPLVDACLRRALDLDAAYMAGIDEHGVVGVYGGVWFNQRWNPTPAALRGRPGHHSGRRTRVRASSTRPAA